MKTPCMRSAVPIVGVALAVIGLTSCAATRQARSVEPSGFLGGYSNLEPGGGDQALLVYLDRGA